MSYSRAVSEASVRVTRDLISAGQLLKIDVCDHAILGHGGKHTLLKTMRYISNKIASGFASGRLVSEFRSVISG